MEPTKRALEPRTAQGSMFEALFQRAFPPKGPYADALKAAGYDPARPEAAYPPSIWKACVGVARQHCFPALDEAKGYRALGGPFVDAFLDTLAGRIVAAALPLVGIDGLVGRLGRYMKLGRSDVEVVSEQVGPSYWRIRIDDPIGLHGEFMAGVVERVLRQKAPSTEVVHEASSPTSYVLAVRW